MMLRMRSTVNFNSDGRVRNNDNKKQHNNNEKYDALVVTSEPPRKNGEKVISVDRAAVYQTPATAAPNIFFLMRRCLNGRKVACIRSKEIAARFATEAAGKKYVKLEETLIISKLLMKTLIFQKLQSLPNNKLLTIKLYATNMSATARLITRYMLRLRRIRSFR